MSQDTQNNPPDSGPGATNPLSLVLLTTIKLIRHILDVLLGALIMMKQPLSALVAILFTLLLLASSITLGYNAAIAAIASYNFCNLPFTALIPACAVPATSHPLAVERVDFPGLMSIQHRALDDFMGRSSTGSELALDIKHAELTVQDLIVLVRTSNLTIKDPLSDALVGFVAEAKETSRGLQRLSSKILGAIDSITAFNAYALRELDRASHKGNRVQLDAALAQTFQASMGSFSSQISRLLVAASQAANSLDRLEEHLTTAHALCLQEAIATTFAQDDLLWRLWSILGGNREQRRDLKSRSSVLKEVQQYRAFAMAYVVAAMQTLTAIDADLTDLRERLMATDISAKEIPVAVHIASIQQGLHRMQRAKTSSRDGHVGSIGDAQRPVAQIVDRFE